MNKNIVIAILVVLLIAFIAAIVMINRSSEAELSNANSRIIELEQENKRLTFRIDSVNELILKNGRERDSLMKLIDSSNVKYRDLEIKFRDMKDSVRYLGIDESILFFKEEMDR